MSSQGQPRLELLHRLGSFGDAPALLAGSATVTYSALAELIEQQAARLGPVRRLVLVEAANTLDAVVGYLAALRGGHAVILADHGRSQLVAELTRRFDPDVVVGTGGWAERRAGSRHDLHPDLALLLSTSGSTGSPKLVRLSHRNVQTNAEAIAGYLKLTGADRAVTSLPLGYCYGLSVLHSHLQVGGSLVLTERSVVDPAFWSLAGSRAVTSFAAVPHTFALLDRTELAWYALPSLRYVTQAGGRMPPEEVRRVAGLGRDHGWELFVMYGQTEATARMAYLPPEAVAGYAHCVGRAIPGGRLRVEAPRSGEVGELVYSGPNVMMGYAQRPAELAEPPALDELRTGDLARECAPGLFEIVGRRARFAKIMGHRVDLDRVEAELRAFAAEVACTSDDRSLLLASTGGDPSLLRRRAARVTGLPPGLVRVRHYAALPRLGSGKPDYPALVAAEQPVRPDDSRVAALQACYAEVLGLDRVPEAASFTELGGDSLSFVEASLRVEAILGRLPPEWPDLPLRDLAARGVDAGPRPDRGRPGGCDRVAGPARAGASPTPRRSWLARIDTSAVLRAVAIALVVLTHVEAAPLRGGAHLLVAVAGFTFARFALTRVRATDRVRGLTGSTARLALPSMAFIAVLVALDDGYGLANIFLVNHYLGPAVWDQRWNFWFVEALVEILAGLCLLLSIPAVRRFERRHTVLLPALLLGLGLLVRYNAFGWSDLPLRYGRPHTVFWLFALGWLVQRAQTTPQRVLVSGLAVLTLTGYFPGEPLRVLIVQAGVLLLVWSRSLPLPRPLGPVVGWLAAASLWIYLTHWVVWPVLVDRLRLPAAATALACLAVGVVAHRLVDAALSRLARAWRRVRLGPNGAAPGGHASGQQRGDDEQRRHREHGGDEDGVPGQDLTGAVADRVREHVLSAGQGGDHGDREDRRRRHVQQERRDRVGAERL